MAEEFDLTVIGAGPGGYVAAIRGAQLGMKTAVIESSHLGGICLNWGCIPTKALLRSAEVYHTMKHCEEYGLKCKGVDFDFKKIIQRSRDVSAKLSGGIAHLLKKNKVTVIDGHGKLLGNGKVEVIKDKKKSEVKSKHIIVATGARARILKGLEPDGKHIWTYKEAMTPDTLPKSLLVIGSGAIGIEFASFYSMLGVDVTVAEIADRILLTEDKEVAAIAHKSFINQGIKIVTGVEVKGAVVKSGKVEVNLVSKDGKGDKKSFDRVICAAGVVANVEEIGLEKTKVKLEKGFIKTDGYCATDEPNVYAIGDVTAPPWLAHKASHEGVVCVEKIAGQAGVHPIDKNNIAGCIYSHPQLASVGLTEEKAKEAGYQINVGRFPFSANGKAIALGDTDGLIKTIFDKKNRGVAWGTYGGSRSYRDDTRLCCG